MDTARQLAVLKLVNKDFRDAADKLQQADPAVHRAASEQRLAHAIGEAVREWESAFHVASHGTTAERKKVPDKREEIKARLAAVVHSLDLVIVDLSVFQGEPQVVEAFQDALSRHRSDPTLEISAREGDLLNQMTRLLDARPQLLRSLVVRSSDIGDSGPGSGSSQAKLSNVLARQTNLTALRLQHGTGRSIGSRVSKDLGRDGFDQAIASLPSLKSLAVCGYAFVQDSYREYNATTLIGILRKLPELEELDMHNTSWDLADFTQFVSSLPALRRLQHLDLRDTYVRQPSEMMGEYVRHLARVLPDLANLQTLNLAGRQQLGPEECSCLTASLARAPALKHLHLPVPRQPGVPAGSQGNPVDPATLMSILHPVAKRRGLHIHLRGLDDASLALIQRALPALRISSE